MNGVRILDCTLRDGAYVVDKFFGENVIQGIIGGLVKSKIDIIEIGFLQNEGKGEGKTIFFDSTDAEKYIIPNEKCSYAVLADYSRYNFDNLDEYSGKSFDIVRVCFFKKERYDVIASCRKVKEKGYKVFIQPVDIMGYSDEELLDLIKMINEVEPYCFSIVDTFGSMYSDDLERIFTFVNHNLNRKIQIGFHSHNNLQLSSSLSQEFIRMAKDKRDIVVATTLNGMGRGAGNTPTELVVQYMNAKQRGNYDLDFLLDTINVYIDNIRQKVEWGYTIPLFIAGCFGAHVNNVSYLLKRNCIRAKDIRYLINSLDVNQRKRYDYDLLENKYLNYITSDIDDNNEYSKLGSELNGKNILLLATGKSIIDCRKTIQQYILDHNCVVICINNVIDKLKLDYIFISNNKRFDYWKNNNAFKEYKKIVTSNISTSMENVYKISIRKLVKSGWNNLDNALILALRFLDNFDLSSLAIAGADGYFDMSGANYAVEDFENNDIIQNADNINNEIENMLLNFKNCRKSKYEISFITNSRYEEAFTEGN